jgi:ribosome assembly protein 1
MAERFVLARIWQMYRLIKERKYEQAAAALFPRTVALSREQQQLLEQVASRSLDKMTAQNVAKRFGQAWLPAADALLTAVCRQIPSPPEAMHERIASVFPELLIDSGSSNSSGSGTATTTATASDGDTAANISSSFSSSSAAAAAVALGSGSTLPLAQQQAVRAQIAALRSAVASCRADPNGPALAFMSKVFACQRNQLPASSRYATAGAAAAAATTTANGEGSTTTSGGGGGSSGGGGGSNNTDTVFLGFARVFAGVLRRDQAVHVLQPRWDPLRPVEALAPLVAAGQLELFLMMGRDLIPIDEAPAGNVVAIAGLQQHVSSKKCRITEVGVRSGLW